MEPAEGVAAAGGAGGLRLVLKEEAQKGLEEQHYSRTLATQAQLGMLTFLHACMLCSCLHTWAHSYAVYAHLQKYTQTICTHAPAHAHIYTHVCVLTRIYIPTGAGETLRHAITLYTHTYSNMHTRVHARMHTRMYTHLVTHYRACTNAHVHARMKYS